MRQIGAKQLPNLECYGKKNTHTSVINGGPGRGRRARQLPSREPFLPVMTIPPQHQEMVVFVLDQKWGKQQVVFSMANLWHLHIWMSWELSACMHVCSYDMHIFVPFYCFR